MSNGHILGAHLQICWDKRPETVRRLLSALEALGYDFVALELGGNFRFSPSIGARAPKSAWAPEEVAALVRHACDLGLKCVPVVSLLSHPEAMPRNPRFVDRRFGLKLWEKGVYRFVEEVVREAVSALTVPGRFRPRYFHARMDEAWEALRRNSEMLGRTAWEVLADHIRKVNEIVKRYGCRLVIYHDMLLSPSVMRIATAHGGPPLNTARALDLVPRDVVINFWLYDFMPRHAPAVEHFVRRGFEVWLSPWMAPELGMAQYAAKKGLTLLATTWWAAGDLLRRHANLRGLVLSAVFFRNPDLPPSEGLDIDPLITMRLELFRPPEDLRLHSLRPLILPAFTAGRVPEVLERIKSVRPPSFIDWLKIGRALSWKRFMLFGSGEDELERRILSAPRPLRVVRPDGRTRKIDKVNAPRGEGEVVLYTRSYGPTTRTNPFGGEIVVVWGVVQDWTQDWYGAGNHPIPPGSFVISVHCGGRTFGEALRFFKGIKAGDKIGLVDAEGRDLISPPPSERLCRDKAVEARFPPDLRSGRELVIVHGTVLAANDYVLLGVVELEGEKGRREVFEVRYGRHLGPFSMAVWLRAPDGEPERSSWLHWGIMTDEGPLTLWATRFKARVPFSSVRLVPTEAGLEVGWCVVSMLAG